MQKNDFSEKISLYYYFSCLDEARAQALTAQIIKKIKLSQSNRIKSDFKLSPKNFVKIVTRSNEDLKNKVKATGLAFSTGQIILPAQSDWGPWFEFRKLANENDFEAVLLNKVLKINETDIAQGLNIPIGTVRYRIGKGLKLLGTLCKKGSPLARK